GLPDEVNLDDRELVKIEAMINCMTLEERRNPTVFVTTSWEEIASQREPGKKNKRRRADYNPERVRRISRGSGRSEDEVKELLQKFGAMRQMMVQLGASTGLLGKIPGFKQFSQMKRLAGLDLGAMMGGGMPGMAAAGGGGGGGMGAVPSMPMNVPGLPPGYTMPGTRAPAPSASARPNDRNRKKNKRKAEKAARKKSRKKR